LTATRGRLKIEPVPRDPRYDVLFEPVRIGPKTLRNRFYQVPHCSGFSFVKPWSQARHRSTKAEGGWAAVCTEFCSITPETDQNYGCARLWDEADVRALAVMCDEVHGHGALAGVELHHGGVHAGYSETRYAPIAPSQIAADSILGATPKRMELDDIRRVQADWVDAARRARDAGFDIVYVYGGHTFLPMQFLSPYYNKRTDAYGGSLENRARFWLETLEQLKEAVGDDCAIASRISVDEITDATVEVDEALEFVRMADHLVDLWDVNVSSILEWSKDSGTSRFYPEGYQLQWTGRVKEVATKPVVGVSRVTSPDLMVEIVTTGKWDIIGAARPSIADPFLPQKIEEGRLDDIRECVGNNLCISRAGRAYHLACTQNATAGEEFRRGWHPERYSPAENAEKDVLVVGAGPAGMECAMVLGRRGMRRVHLVDADADLGGCMRWMPSLPGLGQWARIVNYRRIQLDKLANVELIGKTRLDAPAVLDYGAYLVVVATGSHWAPDGLNGVTRGPIPGADASLAHVLTPEQIMLEGKAPAGRRVVVYDCDGYVVGSGLAEKLVGDGFEVELVTPHGAISHMSDETLEGAILRKHLHAIGVAQRAKTSLLEVGQRTLRAEGEFGEELELRADSIVLVTQRVSDEQLYLDLVSDPDALVAAGIAGVYRAGDCVAPRRVHDVIFDGHRLGREIDSENPALPKPYLREGYWHRVEALAPAG
jgi:dimethylamine/trimethylamine dehydrogenase